MDYAAIASEVETPKLSQSSVHKYMGNNVKSLGLQRGTYYIIRHWSVKSLKGGDNPFWLGQFIGAGESADHILAETPRAKLMATGLRYFFKRPSGECIGAANFNGALVINDDNEQRITFYALLLEAREDALPLDMPTLRRDKTNPVKPAAGPREARPRNTGARQPKISQPRMRRARSEEPEAIDEEKLKGLFKKSEPRMLTEYVVAEFLNESDAKQFAESENGQYRVEGLAHTVQTVLDVNIGPSKFIAKAKAAGAFNGYIYRR